MSRRFLPRKLLLFIALFATSSCLILFCFLSWQPFHTKHRHPAPRASRIIAETVVFPQSGNDVSFNQPWKLPPVVLKNADYFYKDTSTKTKFIVSNFTYSKGLGNLMFQYASLASAAKERDAQIVLPADSLLRRAFPLEAIFVPNQLYKELIDSAKSEGTFYEYTDCCKFRELPHFAHGQNLIAIVGYLQNRRYFDESNAKFVREQFKFHEEIIQMVSDQFQTYRTARVFARSEKIKDNDAPDEETFIMDPDALTEDVYFIGVHVRRGMDMTMNSRNLRHGQVAAPIEYYKEAMRLAKETRHNVAFLICGDDMSWIKKNFIEEEKGSLFFCPGMQREIDMALLSLCDSLIISTGTFSWWSAYLNDKADEIYYYSGWPLAGSPLDQMINRTEYFPPTWKSFP